MLYLNYLFLIIWVSFLQLEQCLKTLAPGPKSHNLIIKQTYLKTRSKNKISFFKQIRGDMHFKGLLTYNSDPRDVASFKTNL